MDLEFCEYCEEKVPTKHLIVKNDDEGVILKHVCENCLDKKGSTFLCEFFNKDPNNCNIH